MEAESAVYVTSPLPAPWEVGGRGGAVEGEWRPDSIASGASAQLFNDSGEVWQRAGENSSSSSVIQVYYEQLLAHPHITMRDELSRYATPVLIVFGNLSNLLTFVVLRRKTLGQHSVCFYLAMYALANVMVLNLILGIAWLCMVLEMPYIGAMADWGCRLWTFVSNVIIYCGIWFVVVLSIDRVIYLCYTHKATTYCTLFAAKVITIIIMIMLIVVSVHAMWTFELHVQGCFVSSHTDDLHIKIWPLWSATIYSYLPLTMLLFLNIVLSVSLCLKHHRQRSSESVNNSDDFTVTTLVVSSSFFLLTVPATVINAIDIYFPMSHLSLELIAEIELTKKITEILSAINQTLLGVILLIFSRAFRHEVWVLLSSFSMKRRPKVYEMRHLSNSADCCGGSSGGGGGAIRGHSAGRSPGSRSHIEYEVCNSVDMSSV